MLLRCRSSFRFASMLHCAASCRALPYCTSTLICEIRVAPRSEVKPRGRDHSPCVCACLCVCVWVASFYGALPRGRRRRLALSKGRACRIPSGRISSLRSVNQGSLVGPHWLPPLPVGLTCSAVGIVITSRSSPPLNQPRRQRRIRPWPESFVLQCAQRACECDLQRPCFFLGILFFFRGTTACERRVALRPGYGRITSDSFGSQVA